jgi:hypothetical protein
MAATFSRKGWTKGSRQTGELSFGLAHRPVCVYQRRFPFPPGSADPPNGISIGVDDGCS